MARLLKTVISAGTLAIFALVLSGVLFCAVSPAWMPGMEGMNAAQCPAALDLHFDVIQTLTGVPLNFALFFELIALTGAAAIVVVSIYRTTPRLTGALGHSPPPHWLAECFRRGILHPKIYPLT